MTLATEDARGLAARWAAWHDFTPREGGAWPSKWKQCAGCRLDVWLTKRGKLCKHLPEPDGVSDRFALLSSGVHSKVPRCTEPLPLSKDEREFLFAWVREFTESTWTRTLRDEGHARPPDVVLPPVLSVDTRTSRDLWQAAMEGHWPASLEGPEETRT